MPHCERSNPNIGTKAVGACEPPVTLTHRKWHADQFSDAVMKEHPVTT